MAAIVDKARYDVHHLHMYNLCNEAILQRVVGDDYDRIRELAKSVGCLINKKCINSSKQLIPIPKLKDTWEINHQFGEEPAIGHATAFLIGDRYALTAAHAVCLRDPGADKNALDFELIRNLRLIFDFHVCSEENVKIEEEFKGKTYRIDQVISYQFCVNTHKKTHDWAVLLLDRKVRDRSPLILDKTNVLQRYESVYMLGHPRGLPMKLSICAGGVKEIQSVTFTVPIDAYSGNSGSPLFDLKTHTVIGMLLAGPLDQESRNREGYYSSDEGETFQRIDKILEFIPPKIHIPNYEGVFMRKKCNACSSQITYNLLDFPPADLPKDLEKINIIWSMARCKSSSELGSSCWNCNNKNFKKANIIQLLAHDIDYEDKSENKAAIRAGSSEEIKHYPFSGGYSFYQVNIKE